MEQGSKLIGNNGHLERLPKHVFDRIFNDITEATFCRFDMDAPAGELLPLDFERAKDIAITLCEFIADWGDTIKTQT